MTIKSVVKPDEQDFGNTEVVRFDIDSSDLELFESWPASKDGLLSIHHRSAQAPFLVLASPSHRLIWFWVVVRPRAWHSCFIESE